MSLPRRKHELAHSNQDSCASAKPALIDTSPGFDHVVNEELQDLLKTYPQNILT